ncbi:MAG: hypothetical protein EA390_08465 [Balneolaceae bacterium]|nr:MAG: hypothetical protein EA390_08465 [Balneolaceae bacterium]
MNLQRANCNQTKKLFSYDKKYLFGNKAYWNGHHKFLKHRHGLHNGVLDKATLTQCVQKTRAGTVFNCIG